MTTLERILRDNKKDEMSRDPKAVAGWRDELISMYSALATIHAGETPESPLPRYAKRVNTSMSDFCPYIQFIRVDALDPKDYPWNQADNSVYIVIKVDLADKTFEVSRCGHINLSPAECRRTNMAAASMKSVVLLNGGKWFRRTKYKDVKDFAKKVTKVWEDAMAIISQQTDGYPYKRLRDDATPMYASKTA